MDKVKAIKWGGLAIAAAAVGGFAGDYFSADRVESTASNLETVAGALIGLGGVLTAMVASLRKRGN